MLAKLTEHKVGALDLWKRGQPLSEAWWHFASPKMRARYRRPKLSRKLSPKSGFGMLANAYRNQPDGPAMAKAVLDLQRLTDRHVGSSKARHEMQTSLVDRLQGDKLIAFGFPRDAPVDASPVPVPLRLLLNVRNFHWASDTISSPPHEFTSVRIVRSSLIKLSSYARTELMEKPKRGRRPIDGLLRPIVCELQGNKEFVDKSQKEKAALVRDSRQTTP
jgi:hypothetical protein